MKEVFIVYKTDNHHTYASMDLLGASGTMPGAIKLVLEQTKKEDEQLSDDDMRNLRNIMQTQGYQGYGEFVIVKLKMDELL